MDGSAAPLLDFCVEADGAIRPPLELLEALGMPPGTRVAWVAEVQGRRPQPVCTWLVLTGRRGAGGGRGQAGRLTLGPLHSFATPPEDDSGASTSVSPNGAATAAAVAAAATVTAGEGGPLLDLVRTRRIRGPRPVAAPKTSASAFALFSKHMTKQVSLGPSVARGRRAVDRASV
jgi:hypothetical protein